MMFPACSCAHLVLFVTADVAGGWACLAEALVLTCVAFYSCVERVVSANQCEAWAFLTILSALGALWKQTKQFQS